jgi:hypothetical protein
MNKIKFAQKQIKRKFKKITFIFIVFMIEHATYYVLPLEFLLYYTKLRWDQSLQQKTKDFM